MTQTIAVDGFAIVHEIINPSRRNELSEALGSLDTPGRRGLLQLPVVAELAGCSEVIELLRPYLPGPPRPVRAIYFDKSPDANWLVTWHQDLAIPVQARVDCDGFGPWSIKDGIPHVQPPIEFLERMLTLRLHLDDCNEENGALRVIPGSHQFGRLDSSQISKLRLERREFICAAKAGDTLLMRPLLLHASGKSKTNGNRRILHIEYAGCELPGPLAWHEAA